ncbi:MAG: hypothetical protein E7195_08895 [Peptococcaceae bacterium]|nr:hypothetical protein [Peptococcaceae bacterium]
MILTDENGCDSEWEQILKAHPTVYLIEQPSNLLTIAYDKGLFDKLQEFKEDMVVIEEIECYLKPAISITIGDKDSHIGDDLMREKWQKVWNWFNSVL